jgi:phage terminase small subunit
MNSKPELSVKQARFAELFVQLGSAVEAYRRAYDAAKMTESIQRKRASELLRHPGVAARIAELRAKASERAEITIADVMRSLATNLQIAMGERTIKTKVMVRNRETGEASAVELDVHDRDGSVAAKTADILLKALGGYEIDHVQAAEAVAAARAGDDVSDRDLARAVLDILRCAQLNDAPTDTIKTFEAPDEPEEIEFGGPPPHGSAGSPAGAPPAVGRSRRPTAAAESFAVGGAPVAAATKRAGLAPGECETFENGAAIYFDAELNKYLCFDASGHLHSYKRNYEVAVAFARSLPAKR